VILLKNLIFIEFRVLIVIFRLVAGCSAGYQGKAGCGGGANNLFLGF